MHIGRWREMASSGVAGGGTSQYEHSNATSGGMPPACSIALLVEGSLTYIWEVPDACT